MRSLELTSKSVHNVKKAHKTKNVGYNLSILRKPKGTGTLDFDIFGKLMHERIFLYPL